VTRAPLLALALLALLVIAAPPALADATLDKNSVVANTEVDVTVSATVEELNTYTDKLTVEVPDGFRVLSCQPVEEFVCSQASLDKPRRTVLTWKRTSPGRPVALRADEFPFRIRASEKPGQYRFAVTQFYSSGAADHSDHQVEVTPGARPAVSTTVASRAAARPASVTPPRPAVTIPSPAAEPEWFADSDAAATLEVELGADTGGSRAPLMVALGVVATVAAGGVFWFRRRIRAASR
jgi:LPXTG-motif cell wall-anchored protein